MSFPKIIRKFCLNDLFIFRRIHSATPFQQCKPRRYRVNLDGNVLLVVTRADHQSFFRVGHTRLFFFFLRYLLRLLFAICGVVPDVGFIGQKRLREDRQSELSTASLIVFARIRTFPFSSVSASCFYFHLISSARLIPTLSPDKLS